MNVMSAGVNARGFERGKKSEQGEQDILSYRSVLSSFTTSSSNIYNATWKQTKNDSLIAENLHTDKKEEEEEGEGEEMEKEEVALGREKMSRIQSMFSGEKKQVDEEGVLSSPSCTDFNELMDEGLILVQEHTTPLSQV